MYTVYLWNPRPVGLYNKLQGFWPVSFAKPFDQCEQDVKSRRDNGLWGDYTIHYEQPPYTNNEK